MEGVSEATVGATTAVTTVVASSLTFFLARAPPSFGFVASFICFSAKTMLDYLYCR